MFSTDAVHLQETVYAVTLNCLILSFGNNVSYTYARQHSICLDFSASFTMFGSWTSHDLILMLLMRGYSLKCTKTYIFFHIYSTLVILYFVAFRHKYAIVFYGFTRIFT